MPVKIWDGGQSIGSAWAWKLETYIDADQVDLGVTVLARLGGGHVNDLAGTTWGGGRRQLADWARDAERAGLDAYP